MKNHKLGILKVRDNFQSCGEIESTQEFEVSVMKKMSINLDIFFCKSFKKTY